MCFLSGGNFFSTDGSSHSFFYLIWLNFILYTDYMYICVCWLFQCEWYDFSLFSFFFILEKSFDLFYFIKLFSIRTRFIIKKNCTLRQCSKRGKKYNLKHHCNCVNIKILKASIFFYKRHLFFKCFSFLLVPMYGIHVKFYRIAQAE